MAQMGMRDIKRRIRSIKNTRQITRGMELVAAAKLRKARSRYEETRPYFNTVVSTMRDIAKNSRSLEHPFLQVRNIKSELYIIITSDRGLCGGYNINIIKEVLSLLKDGVEHNFIAVGRRGRDYLKARGHNIIKEYPGISEKPEFEHAREIGDMALRLFKDGKVGRINIAYTKFVSTISQEPKILPLLPVTIEDGETEGEDMEDLMTYEPSQDKVFEILVPIYVHSSVFGALVESSASEQAARRVAMESATDNANKMIDELVLSYNRARQEIITREISEIVGGAEAIE